GPYYFTDGLSGLPDEISQKLLKLCFARDLEQFRNKFHLCGLAEHALCFSFTGPFKLLGFKGLHLWIVFHECAIDVVHGVLLESIGNDERSYEETQEVLAIDNDDVAPTAYPPPSATSPSRCC